MAMKTDGEWIGAAEVGRRLGIHLEAVRAVADANEITRRELKGTRTRYLASEVDRLAASIIVKPAAGLMAEAGAR